MTVARAVELVVQEHAHVGIAGDELNFVADFEIAVRQAQAGVFGGQARDDDIGAVFDFGKVP